MHDRAQPNLYINCVVAVRELSLTVGGPNYTILLDTRAIGTMEAKPVGHSLIGVEEQPRKLVVSVLDTTNLRVVPLVWPIGETALNARECSYAKCRRMCG